MAVRVRRTTCPSAASRPYARRSRLCSIKAGSRIAPGAAGNPTPRPACRVRRIGRICRTWTQHPLRLQTLHRRRLALRTISWLDQPCALALLAMAAARKKVVRDNGLLPYSHRPLQPILGGHLTPRPDRGQPRTLSPSPNLTLKPLSSDRNLRYHALQPTRYGAQSGINEFVDFTHETLNWVFHPNAGFICEPHAAKTFCTSLQFWAIFRKGLRFLPKSAAI